MILVFFHNLRVLVLTICVVGFAQASEAADRDRLKAFLAVTGFDAALESIKLSAGSAPQMIGVDPGTFGSAWARLSGEVFDTDLMHGLALDILEQTLDEDLLTHAAGFYATDLGQRLVEVENASHLNPDDTTKTTEGRKLVSDWVAEGNPRVELLKRMNQAIDVSGNGARAMQEIQMRFILAASAAGIIDLRMDAGELRAYMKSQENDLRLALRQSALAGAAYTYRSFSDADITDYVEALEDPKMKKVYELMNAVQFEIMANRFEELAARMADLSPGSDI